jgi:hypothetical protein
MTAVGDYNCTLQPGSSNTASNAPVNGTTKGRHLLQQRHSKAEQHHNPAVSARTLQQAAGSGSQYSCKKLGAGGL